MACAACAGSLERKRRILVIATLAMLLLEVERLQLLYPQTFGIYVPREIDLSHPLRENVTFESVTAVYSKSSFRRAFRMDKRVFYKLLSLIGERISKNEEMGRRSRRTNIKADTRLAITLRMPAGRSYLDLMLAYQVSDTAVYEIFHSTCNALMAVLKLPGLPDNVPGLRQLSEGFKASRSPQSPLSGCVGALDGIAIKIKKPSSTHDSLAHTVSALGHYLEAGRLETEFWIAGDEAYACTESLITPFPSSQADEWEDAFNFWHSSLRMHVEQAFGMLFAKWRILNFSVEVDAKLICLTMKLHNFCIDHSYRRSSYSILSTQEKMDLVRDCEEWYEEAKEDAEEANEDYERPTESVSQKRDKMVQIVKRRCLVRPPTSGARMREIFEAQPNAAGDAV